jgi:hypothetical protein
MNFEAVDAMGSLVVDHEALMSGLADRVDTVRDRGGTRVTLLFEGAVAG